MNICKTALRVIVRHPGVVVNALVIGLMGVFVMSSFTSSVAEDLSRPRPKTAVIDHDNSVLSRALAGFLEERGEPVRTGQTKRDLQDAAAKNEAAYILVIPAGFERDFAAGVRADAETPLLETVVSLAAAQGRYMEQLTSGYLRAVRAGLIADPDAGMRSLTDQADRVAGLEVQRGVVPKAGQVVSTTTFRYYMRWAGYPLTVGVIALSGYLFRAFGTGEVRRRNLAAPVSGTRLAGQIGLAVAVVAVGIWAWNLALGFAPTTGGVDALDGDPGGFAVAALALLLFAAVPLAVGFLAAQTGMGMAGITALANILGLVFAFLGGGFMDDSFSLSPGVQAFAQFIPSSWHSRAIDGVFGSIDVAAGSWGAVAAALGVELLFAAVIAAAGLLVGRLRLQTADAGGNYADDSE
ncbi:MAG: ABC transporter permease [Bifidobacteriaceae bacterium]|jgi:ABC-2 type transport system permease protein|nr:ABC transporter permease [Bifidobacteriaceae bacterium]